MINDGTGSINIILWGEQSKIMENTYFQNNELIRIIGGYSKRDLKGNLEVHLGRNGKIILDPDDVNLSKFPLLEELKHANVSKKGHLKIRDLQNFIGYIKILQGVIERVVDFKEINLKNGEKTFLLRFILKDNTSSISVLVWGMNAIKCFKNINQGEKVKIYNVIVRFNKFNQQKEIYFTKNSKLFKI